MSVARKEEGLTNRLIARLKELIARGVLAPGCRLPPERELAPAFGVSRSSLRHALKALETMGVLTQRVGDGTYLTADSAQVLREPLELLILIDGISLPDLLETRLIVEPELAARAAERATVEDLARMRAALEAMERERDPARFNQYDIAFHQAIFLAARNPVCNRIFSLIQQSMLSGIAVTSRRVDAKHTLSYHRPIYAAIADRKPDAARKRMAEHLLDARHLLEDRPSADRRGIVQAIAAIQPQKRKPAR